MLTQVTHRHILAPGKSNNRYLTQPGGALRSLPPPGVTPPLLRNNTIHIPSIIQ